MTGVGRAPAVSSSDRRVFSFGETPFRAPARVQRAPSLRRLTCERLFGPRTRFRTAALEVTRGVDAERRLATAPRP